MELAKASLQTISGNLNLPAKSFDSLSFCDTEPEAIQEYVNSLPYTNPPEMCKLLYSGLPELAGLTISSERKVDILNAFLPATLNCVDKLTMSTAVNEKTVKSLSLAQALLRILGEGYKSTAVAASQESSPPTRVLTESIFAAMSLMNRTILICWQSYMATPENFWQELHSLYQLACHFELENQSVSPGPSKQPVALRSAYLKPLLISSANAGRFTPMELRSIYNALDQLTNLADLSSSHESGLFLVDTTSNAGPVYTSQAGSPSSNCLSLRTDRLVAALKIPLDENEKERPLLSERIVTNLCAYWEEEKIRRDEHQPDTAELTVVLGIAPIHRLLSRTADLDEFLVNLDQTHHGNDYALFAGRKAGHLQDMESANDVWHDAYDSMDTKHGFAAAAKPEDAPIQFKKVEVSRKPKERKKIRGYTATRINKSARGACIELRDAPPSLSPGELIYVRDKATNAWRLGIIRWLQVTPKLHRLAGVEFIPGNIRPCAACVIKVERPVSPYLPGLLLQDGKREEVILPSMPFKLRQRARLLSMESEKICPLRKITDTTFHLTRFLLDF